VEIVEGLEIQSDCSQQICCSTFSPTCVAKSATYPFLNLCCAFERFNMVQHGSTWFNMVQHGSTWFNMVQHGSTWFNMVQHGSTTKTRRPEKASNPTSAIPAHSPVATQRLAQWASQLALWTTRPALNAPLATLTGPDAFKQFVI